MKYNFVAPLKHVDILVICETKLDETFPNSQFHMNGFPWPYRPHRNSNVEDVITFVKEDLIRKLLTKHNFPRDVEDLFVERNFRKSKWLLFGTYHLLAQND